MTRAIRNGQHVVKLNRPRRTPAGDAFSLFAITALQLAGYLTAAGDALAKPAGQSSARWQVLAAARHQSISVAEVARILGLARQGVQRLADVLEAEGLITYRDNPRHQRARLVALTKEGAARLAMIETAQAKWADAMGALFPASQMTVASAVMARVLKQLQEDQRGAAKT